MTGMLSAFERRVLAAAAGALVGAPAEHVPDKATPLLRRLPSGDRLMLRALLRALELAPLLRPGVRRFTVLAPAEREALLRAWATSRLPAKRRGWAVLRALSLLAYYGDERAWPEVGYRGPWLGRVPVAVLPAPSLATGLTAGREARTDLRIRAQVCVVGTGAGGAALLARLAERGVDVVAVEAGGHPTAGEFTQRELEMLPLLYQEAGLRATADQAIGILQGRGAGGSTLHNTGLVYAPPEGIIERWRREHGFPLTTGELQGYVRQARDALHAAPIPAELINANNTALQRGAEALGWRFRLAEHNRAACSACGYCMLGCAYNRKFNAALTLLPRAVETGARILTDAVAERVSGRSGARRVHCSLRDARGRPTGVEAVIEAPVVVVAAGALDSPALLLRSGLGGGWVGRGLRLHPTVSVAAEFTEPVVAWRGLPQSVVVEQFASFLEHGRGGWLLIAAAANWPGLGAVLLPGMGTEHRLRMRAFSHLASASVLLHDETAGRVGLGRGGRPRAHYWPGAEDRAALRQGIGSLARLYLAAGAQRVYLPGSAAPAVHDEAELNNVLLRLPVERYRVMLNSVHPQGSLPLGTDRRGSAVDPERRLWGEPGIRIADASAFPTSVGVPPQITIMALAAATADLIAEEQ